PLRSHLPPEIGRMKRRRLPTRRASFLDFLLGRQASRQKTTGRGLRLGIEGLEPRALLAWGVASDDYLTVGHGKTLDFTKNTNPAAVLSFNDAPAGAPKQFRLNLGSVVAGPSKGVLSRLGPYGGLTY